MTTAATAPPQLPFAPKPFAQELFSSWMLRIAGVNCVSLQELILGLQSRHPHAPSPNLLDWGLPPGFLTAMSQFSGTPIRTLQSLDLRTRFPMAENALLLRFTAISDRSPYLRNKRSGYAFCPICISQQPSVHVRWDWIFPALLRCHIHRSPLRHGCPECRDDDPLPFGAVPAVALVLCRNCGANLAGAIPGLPIRNLDEAHGVIERTYRTALHGAHPDGSLLGESTGTQFRRFVDDLLLLLAWYPSPELHPRLTDPNNPYLLFRKESLRMIEALVLNAAPASQPRARSIKFQDGLKLWKRVFELLSERDAEWMEDASALWPPALRRRLNSALDHHERSRSQASPFRSIFFRPGLKYFNSLEFQQLNAANDPKRPISGALFTARTLSASNSNRLPRTRRRRD
jgi:hypothetical protein